MYAKALHGVPARPDGDAVNVFIETPAGSRHKIDLDHETGLFSWSLELPLGLVFPYAFGFVPNTLAEDGDPLDVMLLTDGTVPPGTLVRTRLIGVLRVSQDEDGDGDVETPNDRLIAVPEFSTAFRGVEGKGGLRDGFFDEAAGFFRRYNQMIGRAIDTAEPGTAEEARALLDAAMARAENA